MEKLICLVVFSFVASLVGLGQSQTASDNDKASAARVEALSAGLRFDRDVPDDASLGAMTARVRDDVSRYIEAGVAPSASTEQIEPRLRAVLAAHKPDPEVADQPFARVGNLLFGRSLVIGYTIVRGPHHDSSVMAAFREEAGRFRLVATSSDEFDGYGMFNAQLSSPNPAEIAVLAWGRDRTFNGKRIRVRMYTFDGQTFRTVWNPDDLLNASVRAVENGFVIDQDIRTPPWTQRDQYLLTLNGPIKVN